VGTEVSSAPELTLRYRSYSPTLELFGLWQSQPAPEGLSFAAGDAPQADPGGGYWQIDLPAAGADQVEQLFQTHQNDLKEILARLDSIPARAQTILPDRKNPPLEKGGKKELSFEAAALVDLPAPGSPETNLLAGIQAFEGGEPAPGGAKSAVPTSFALGDGLDWGAFQKSALDLLENAQRQLLYYAWVETAQAGQVLARSTVNWLGDLQTTWQQGVTPQQAALHERSLTLALQSRAVTLKTAATLATLAARIVMVFTLSGGLLVALSLAWKFIDEIIRSVV
jgi:hypothetical protein